MNNKNRIIFISLIFVFMLISCKNNTTNPSKITIAQREGKYRAYKKYINYEIIYEFDLNNKGDITVYLADGTPDYYNIVQNPQSTTRYITYNVGSSVYTIIFDSETEISGGRLLISSIGVLDFQEELRFEKIQ